MYYLYYGYFGFDNEYENLKMMKVFGKNFKLGFGIFLNFFERRKLFEFNIVKVCMLKKVLDFF